MQLNLPDLIVPVTSLHTACIPPETSLPVYPGRVWDFRTSAQFPCISNHCILQSVFPCVCFLAETEQVPHTQTPQPKPHRSGWIAESHKNRQSICNRLSLLSYYCCSPSHNPARALFLEYSTGLLSDGISLLHLHSSFHTCTQQPQFMQAWVCPTFP